MPDLFPLSAEEKKLTVRIATEDEVIKKLLGKRFATVLIGPTTLDQKEPDQVRLVAVGFYDYAKSKSIVALVDFDTKRVHTAKEQPAQLQLGEEEMAEAEALAAADQRARDFLQDRNMNPLTRLCSPKGADQHDPPHRYALVILRPASDERRSVVVDLTDRQVLDFLTPGNLLGSAGDREVS